METKNLETEKVAGKVLTSVSLQTEDHAELKSLASAGRVSIAGVVRDSVTKYREGRTPLFARENRGEPLTFAVPQTRSWVRPSVPAPGASLVVATEMRAVHVRAAVDSVRRSFSQRESVTKAWRDVLASRWLAEPLATSVTPARQAAWSLVSMYIVGRSIGALSASASLRDAEMWFLGSIRPPSMLSDFVTEFADREALQALNAIAYDADLRDLLPYILDAHGPGSRASVLKDPGTRMARQAKKTTGVFYTPSDVADYITRETIGESGEKIESALILDPACGSGVFLKSALDLAKVYRPELDRLDFVEHSLYGIDIDPLAVEATCFVLLHECLISNHRRNNLSPWSLWHRIRCNLCVADALTFHRTPDGENRSEDLAALRTELNETCLPPSLHRLDSESTPPLFSPGLPLGSVFPSLTLGADAVIGNPPYAKIRPRDDAKVLKRRFASLAAGDVFSANHFPLFIEMMWRLARPGCSSAGMVVPLSLAYSSRKQMVATRNAITRSGGRWRFAFFDREPHALFGEDVKTRNTIVFRTEDPDCPKSATTIETGPLRKWTSRQRAHLFDEITFTPLIGIPITSGIPKLAGNESARIFEQIMRQTARFREMCVRGESCLPQVAASEHHGKSVFVANTAYNFLNVFRSHRRLPTQRHPWSSSKLLVLEFPREAQAARAFAILSSRMVFWLWRVNGDGFHVPRSFVMNLPFSDRLFNNTQKAILARLGAHLWDEVQTQQIVSVNRGRQTVAYRPHASESLRDEIDSLLFEALELTSAKIERLRAFTRTVIVVDENDETRQRLIGHFH